MNRAQETRDVKHALQRAGIPFTHVGHGRGTAIGWLKINLGPGNFYHSTGAIAVAQETTGRHGDYDGRISILAQ